MLAHGTMETAMLRYWVTLSIMCAPALAASDSLQDAVANMYEFDFAATHQVLNQYIAAHPAEPLPYAFRASAYLFYEMDRLGILESEFLTDDDKIAERKKKLDPDPVVRAKFLQAVSEAENRANAVLKSNPNDRDALFAMAVSQGVSTDY